MRETCLPVAASGDQGRSHTLSMHMCAQLMSDVVPLLRCITDREAINMGIFLYESLRLLNYWRSTEKVRDLWSCMTVLVRTCMCMRALWISFSYKLLPCMQCHLCQKGPLQSTKHHSY